MELAKNRRHYACIHKRIKEDLLEISACEEIKGHVLKQSPEKTLFKARFKSCNNNGRSYGFRAYVLCDKRSSTAYCMEIYPKYGSSNQEAISNSEELKVLSEFKEEREQNTLWQITWMADEKSLTFTQSQT